MDRDLDESSDLTTLVPIREAASSSWIYCPLRAMRRFQSVFDIHSGESHRATRMGCRPSLVNLRMFSPVFAFSINFEPELLSLSDQNA
jgi:hypothetical protein